MTAQTVSIDVSYRNVGAILGGLLGSAAIGVLYALTSIPAIEALLLVRQVLSGESLLPQGGVVPAMLAVPPVSAAIAGWLVAPRAIAGDRWSGVAMGATTYFVATLLGPIVAYGTAPGAQVYEVMAAAPVIAMVALFLLFPLLLVCYLAGAGWAATLRRTARVPEAAQPLPARPFPGVLFGLGSLVLAVGWVPLAAVLGSFSGGAWVD